MNVPLAMNKRKLALDEGEETRPPTKEARGGDGLGSAAEDEGSTSSGSPEAPAPAPVATTTIQLRTSQRVLRRRTEERKESESEEVASAPAGETATEADAVPAEKPKRGWEQWSSEDMAIFFEGLNEFGKNFELIWSHFDAKSKMNRGVYKTREQIRMFYYRTWHKILPHIDFKSLEKHELLKKSSRELYGLINFGELRKRLGGAAFDDRNICKLQDLVFKGHTTVRYKGKTHRVRTPICRALKRVMSRLEGSGKRSGGHKKVASSSTSPGGGVGGIAQTASAIPREIAVELRPMTSGDFHRVHGFSFQNPHLEIRVDPSTRYVPIIILQLSTTVVR